MLPELPKLRLLNLRWAQVDGQPFLALQDPLRLSESSLMVPGVAAPLLGLLDGTRDLEGLRGALSLRTGLELTPMQLENFLGQLDECFLLENGRFGEALAERVERYRGAPFRPMAFAGEVYPADPVELTAALDAYCRDAGVDGGGGDVPARGIISPHIDYQRGWRSYARVWQAARGAVAAAELVIILGTDHSGSAGRFTLTRQSYATPWGTLPTDGALVERLAETLGEDGAFAEEAHHIGEHSVELAAVWLHYVAGGEAKRTLPVLCGFPEILAGGGESSRVGEALSLLAEEAARQPTLVVAAGDISHVGPAFGDSYPFDAAAKSRVRRSDDEWLDMACSGDKGRLEGHLRRNGDPTRICGVSPVLYMMAILEGVPGKVVAYEQCPADEDFGSLVSVAGALFPG